MSKNVNIKKLTSELADFEKYCSAVITLGSIAKDGAFKTGYISELEGIISKLSKKKDKLNKDISQLNTRYNKKSVEIDVSVGEYYDEQMENAIQQCSRIKEEAKLSAESLLKSAKLNADRLTLNAENKYKELTVRSRQLDIDIHNKNQELSSIQGKLLAVNKELLSMRNKFKDL